MPAVDHTEAIRDYPRSTTYLSGFHLALSQLPARLLKPSFGVVEFSIRDKLYEVSKALLARSIDSSSLLSLSSCLAETA